MTYRSDKAEGPTAGPETADPLEFLARVLTHIPDKGQVTTRYYGWYATRPRGIRRHAAAHDAGTAVPIVPPRALAPSEARRRWAELLRQIFEVDPLACPRCGGTMRILAFITQPAVIDQILTHLRTPPHRGQLPRTVHQPLARSLQPHHTPRHRLSYPGTFTVTGG